LKRQRTTEALLIRVGHCIATNYYSIVTCSVYSSLQLSLLFIRHIEQFAVGEMLHDSLVDLGSDHRLDHFTPTHITEMSENTEASASPGVHSGPRTYVLHAGVVHCQEPRSAKVRPISICTHAHVVTSLTLFNWRLTTFEQHQRPV
jgi:hypothetical protein